MGEWLRGALLPMLDESLREERLGAVGIFALLATAYASNPALAHALVRELADAAGVKVALTPISKWDFYKAVESPDHVLTIQTADQALWANVLLSVGVRTE